MNMPAGDRAMHSMMTGVYGTFREQFPIDTSRPRTLSDEESGSVAFLCIGGRGKTYVDKRDGSFSEHLHPDVRAQYERLRTHPYFDRFALFKRGEEGIIVAFGKDDFYYVLATWDASGASQWVPQFEKDDRDRDVLTEACLGR